ncbi:hypothetical protein Dxin01_00817 [Deinococcus xinjiangensis]|uniref:Uncharacterized protein n=1 Tax=Deinococcus xinjiangensis TaxID=457454 RepID=A0ABP9V8R3_9DEIO
MPSFDPQKTAQLLQRRADGLELRASKKETPSYVGLNMTRKRAQHEASKAADAQKLRRLQLAYRVMAQGHTSGTLPAALSKVGAPKVVERLMKSPESAGEALEVWISKHEVELLDKVFPDHTLLAQIKAQPLVYGWRYPLPDPLVTELGQLLCTNRDCLEAMSGTQTYFAEQFSLRSLYHQCGLYTVEQAKEAALLLHHLTEQQWRPEELRQAQIARLERGLHGYHFQGYWPTPPALATALASAADLRAGLKVLEPQAGKGDLVDALLALEPDLHIEVCERNERLRELLIAKGYPLIGDDSMKLRGAWDRIVMNPPFEHFADIAHVRHAYDLLAPGGVLVAVMSESAFFRSERVPSAFREWLSCAGGQVTKNAPDAFKVSSTGRSTNVATRTVKLVKVA